MKTYISLLRGINVSGHKLIKMDALQKMYTDLQFKNSQTYIQSGNVIFQYKPTPTKTLAETIAKQIQKSFGFEVPVMVKELAELTAIANNNPFINKRQEDIQWLHVTLLSEEAEKSHIDKIKDLSFGADEYIIANNAIYVFCPNGYGNTKLNNNFFENKLKVNATTRNWKTITKLLSMAEALESKT
ncbi:MAG: DUF1697 domain-containing protein [Bacteroidota bacterium]